MRIIIVIILVFFFLCRDLLLYLSLVKSCSMCICSVGRMYVGFFVVKCLSSLIFNMRMVIFSSFIVKNNVLRDFVCDRYEFIDVFGL